MFIDVKDSLPANLFPGKALLFPCQCYTYSTNGAWRDRLSVDRFTILSISTLGLTSLSSNRFDPVNFNSGCVELAANS